MSERNRKDIKQKKDKWVPPKPNFSGTKTDAQQKAYESFRKSSVVKAIVDLIEEDKNKGYEL